MVNEDLRRHWSHQAARQESRSRPCASPRHCPRRSGHILRNDNCERPCSRGRPGTSFGKSSYRSHTSDEESVASEDDLLIAVLHEPADAVLGMAGRMKGFDGDAADVERSAVRGGFGDALTLGATNDGQVFKAEFREL